MKIKNNTSFPIVACFFHIIFGFGKQILILPEKMKNIPNPYINDYCEGCYLFFSETFIYCYEGEDMENNFHVSKGKPCIFGHCLYGIVIRHFSDRLLLEGINGNFFLKASYKRL